MICLHHQQVMQKKNTDTPLQLSSENGSLESTVSQSASAPQSTLKAKQSLAKSSIVKDRLTKAILENNNPVYVNTFINTLAKQGYDVGELNKQKDAILEGKKLIQENTPVAYQSEGLLSPDEEVKRNYNLGRGLLLTGNNDAAIEAFTSSLSQLSPDKVQKTQQQFVQTGNQSAAFDNQKTQIEADKNPANALYSIGLAYMNKGDDANANNFFIEALKQDPGSANAMIGLANIAEKNGDKMEAKRLMSDAAAEYKKEGVALQFEAERESDKEKQRKADEMNTIADGLEAFVLGDPKSEMGVLGKLTPWGFAFHNLKEMGTGVAHGLERAEEGVANVLRGDEMTKGAFQITSGLGSAVFSAIPQIAVFNSAIQPINEAAAANPDNKTLNFISKGVERLFTPVSSIAEAVEINPEEGSTGEAFLETLDLVALIGGGKYAHDKITNAESAINSLKNLSDKVLEAKDVAEQNKLKELAQNFVDSINEITASELKKEAEKQNKAAALKAIDSTLDRVKAEREKRGLPVDTYVDDMPLAILTTIDRIDRGIPVDMVALDEASKLLYDKYNFLSKEKENPNRIQSVSDITEIQNRIGEDIAYIEDYKNKMRDAESPLSEINNRVADLETELSNPNLSPESKAIFEERLKQAQAEIQEITRQVAESELETAHIEAMIEAKVEDLKNATTETGKAIIQSEIDALNKSGRSKYDYTQGKRAEDKAIEEGMQFSGPEEAQRYVIENSENPAELATEYLNMDAESGGLDYKSQQIDEYGIKMTDEEFNRNYGRNKKNFTLAKKYIDNKRSIPLDVQLMELSERSGIEITEKDLFDHIENMERERAEGAGSDIKIKFKNKFRDLTGKELTPSLAREIVKEENKKHIENYEEYITRESLSAIEEEQLYYEGIKNGTIPTFDSERYGNVPRHTKSKAGEAARKPAENPVEAKQEPSKPVSDKAKALADKIRSFKHKEQKIIDADGNEIAPVKNGLKWGDNDILEAIAKGVEKTGDLAQAVVDYLNEQEWYRNLSEKNKKAIEKQGVEYFSESFDEVGVSREMREKQLEDLGLPKMEILTDDKSQHTWEYLNKEANRLVDGKEVDPVTLSLEILTGSKKLSDLNVFILERGALDADKKIKTARQEKSAAASIGDKKAADAASDAFFESVADLAGIHEALETGLRSSARAMSAAQTTMREDFSLGGLAKRYKKAFGTKDLPREVIERLDNYAVDLAELSAKIKEQEDVIKQYGSELKEAKAQRVSSEKIVKIKEKRSKLFEEWKASGQDTSKPVQHGAPITDNDVKYAAKIVLSYLEEGVVTTMEASKRLKEDAKKYLGLKLSEEQIYEILDAEVDGKKVIDNFENTGIKSSKLSLSDLVNKAAKETKEPKEKVEKEKKTAEQREKERELVKNANRALNDLRVNSSRMKRKINTELSAIEYSERPWAAKMREGVADVLNVPRSLMASFDFSAPLRQAVVLTATKPTYALKAGKEMFKQSFHPIDAVKKGIETGSLKEAYNEFFNSKNFEEWLVEYKSTDDYRLAHNSELYVADPYELHTGLNGKEEAFMSNLAEKIPVAGQFIKGSERAYVAYLNKMRTDIFRDWSNELIEQGNTFEKNPEKFKAMADLVNNLTGRGKLMNNEILRLEDSAPLLNATLFSPRLMASRINLLNFTRLAKMPPEVRVKYLTSMAKFAGVASTVLWLFKLNGADVETDPRSSDFGKIKFGDTRYDILGGFGQYIHLIDEWIEGEKKSTASGKISKLDGRSYSYESKGSVTLKFLRQKLSPSAGMIVDLYEGEDIMGEEVTVPKELYSHLAPLQLQSGLEAYEKGGWPLVIQTLIPSMFGVGVQTYSSRKSENKRKKRMEKLKLRLRD